MKQNSPFTLSPVQTFFMYLMPVSLVAYIAMLYGILTDQLPLLPTVGGMALFYAFWGLRNFALDGNKRERAMFTCGMLALGCYLGEHGEPVIGRLIAIFGCLAVFGSYVFVSKLVVGADNVALAARFRKTVTWAKILKFYMMSQSVTYFVTLVLLVQSTQDVWS